MIQVLELFSEQWIIECDLIERAHTEWNLSSLQFLPQLADHRAHARVPFEVKRVYYLYDVPGGEARGGHAHYQLQQYIVAASGSFDVVLDDGKNKRTVTLNRPNIALHIVPGLWRELDNFSSLDKRYNK